MSELPLEDIEVFQRLKDEFPHYAKKCLKIRTKRHGVIPFELNSAQEHLHEVAEKQLAETGKIRIIILKGRQQGMSTYVEGRFYWRVTHQEGQRAYILTHEGDATNNLFAMVQRFHENCPEEVRPHTDRDSGKELNFDKLDSGYKVGTAGSKGTGRSSTIQYFHGSEVAFWPNAETHATGVMQAIPSESGEIFLESTSDGMGNFFHQMWVSAVTGLNEFIPVFIPWFWQSEYTRAVPDDVVWDAEELKYKDKFPEASWPGMMWRRYKIAEFKNGEDDFKREYPGDIQEAFESAGYRQLIKGEWCGAAREAQEEARGSLVVGVDPARFGDDRTAVVVRRGRVVLGLATYKHLDQMAIVGVCKHVLDNNPVDRMFIDVGMGVGIIDRLHEMGYSQVREVNFGSSAFNTDKYTNRRNEMYQETAEWLQGGHVSLPSDAEEIEALIMDLCAVEYSYNSKNMKVLESKDETKKRLGVSPDLGDALALTFAEPVAEYYQELPRPPRKAYG